MNDKPIVLRERARRDVEDAVQYYLSEAGTAGALAFIDALQVSLRQISDHPAAGSFRYAHELNLPGLRSRTVGKFPYLVFSIEHTTELDVWRILHGARDIPAWMQEPRED